MTAAADKLGLTQSAVTKTIKQLEDEFGTALFLRGAKGMVLSEAGGILRERAKLIQMHHRQAREEITLLEKGHLDRLRIAAGASYHPAIAPELVRSLALKHPETQFVLDFSSSSGAIPRLIDGDLDLVLGAIYQSPPDGVRLVHLLEVNVTVYCDRDHALALSGQAVTPAMLEGAGWALNRADRQMRDRLANFCADNLMMPPRVVMEVDTLAASFRAIKGTQYLLPAPTMVTAMARAEGLEALPLSTALWRYESAAFFPESLKDYPLMQDAIALVKELSTYYSKQE